MAQLMALLVLALALAGLVIMLVWLFRRFRPQAAGEPEPDPLLPLPNLKDVSVSGEVVRVTFGVPMEGDDPILAELLTYYGLEAVKRARRDLPLQDLEEVAILVSHRGGVQEVGRIKFDEAGRLPEGLPVPNIVKLSEAMEDPLESDFAASASAKAPTGWDADEKLAPLNSFLKVSNQAAAALRLQGVDPKRMTAGELVRGLLALRGYTLSEEPAPHTHQARKGAATVLVREVPHSPGSYPELSESDMHRFVMDMAGSRMTKGILVTEKYGPFSVYNLERRDPRIRFITRERLQKALDALALG